MARERHSFPAMGTSATVCVVDGGAGSAADAAELVARCERRWSRFLPDSELSRLNAGAGGWVRLEAETYALVALAVEAWQATAGRFDPTVLRPLVAAGYDRSFPDVRPGAGGDPLPAPGCAGIELDPWLAAVRLPEGVQLDLGGIAKGHTADLVVDHLLAGGAAGALVDLGGDLRVEGTAPAPDGWTIAVEDPFRPGRALGILRLARGAVATSTTLRRRWRGPGDEARHHLLDPATGLPTEGLAAVTVLAGTAALAEVTAKAAMVAGPEQAATVIEAAGATGLLVLADGTPRPLPGLEAFGWS